MPYKCSKKNYFSSPVLMDSLYNFNRTSITDKISYKLKIKNVSNNTLTIRSIDTPCGCIETKISNDAILKNNYCEIMIMFNPQYLGHVQYDILSISMNLNSQSISKLRAMCLSRIR